MQDKEKFYNASPMKYILLSDVINHPDHQAGRLLHIKESTADMVLKFFRSNIKNLKYQFNTKAKTIKINLEEDDYFNCFVVSKIHWLMHDFKVNGVSYAPQGFLQKTVDGDQFAAEIHPGTYRYHAMILAEMYNEYIIVADKENIFPDHKVLSFEEHNELVNKGFIRERKGSYSEVEVSNKGEDVFTLHEAGNHHDWNILKQSEELIKMFTKLTVYTDDQEGVEKLNLIKEQNIDVKITDNGYATIPHKEEWKGISVYIPKSDCMEDHFTLDMILDLDIDTDIVYHIDTGVTIINNSSVGCKRLILEIIQESKPEYLDNFLWARRVVRK